MILRIEVPGAIDLDGEDRAVGQVEFCVDVPGASVGFAAQHLSPGRRQPGMPGKRPELDLGESVPASSDVAEPVTHQRDVPNSPRATL